MIFICNAPSQRGDRRQPAILWAARVSLPSDWLTTCGPTAESKEISSRGVATLHLGAFVKHVRALEMVGSTPTLLFTLFKQ